VPPVELPAPIATHPFRTSISKRHKKFISSLARFPKLAPVLNAKSRRKACQFLRFSPRLGRRRVQEDLTPFYPLQADSAAHNHPAQQQSRPRLYSSGSHSFDEQSGLTKAPRPQQDARVIVRSAPEARGEQRAAILPPDQDRALRLVHLAHLAICWRPSQAQASIPQNLRVLTKPRVRSHRGQAAASSTGRWAATEAPISEDEP
jgi:hypothetical protein